MIFNDKRDRETSIRKHARLAHRPDRKDDLQRERVAVSAPAATLLHFARRPFARARGRKWIPPDESSVILRHMPSLEAACGKLRAAEKVFSRSASGVCRSQESCGNQTDRRAGRRSKLRPVSLYLIEYTCTVAISDLRRRWFSLRRFSSRFPSTATTWLRCRSH